MSLVYTAPGRVGPVGTVLREVIWIILWGGRDLIEWVLGCEITRVRSKISATNFGG